MRRKDWKQTDGTVVKVESIFPRGRRQLIVTFSYEVRGHYYEGVLGTFKPMNVGEALVVKYDASDPKMTKFIADYARTWRIWWIVMTAFLILALLLVLWIRTAWHKSS